MTPSINRRSHLWRISLLLAAVVVTASGCSMYDGCRNWVGNGFKVGPEYCKPAAPVAEAWIDAADRRVKSDPAQTAEWWLTFNDPVLNELVLSASSQNLTLREAGMRVLQARADRGAAVGDLFPQSQTISGDYSRSLISTQTANLFPGISRSFDNWAASSELAWEVDFWGRFRRAVEAADASLDASVENYDDVLVCLIADVAAAYTNIRTLQQRLDFAQQNVEIQQGSLDIVQQRFDNGRSSGLDVEQAKLSLTATQATIPALRAALRQENNLLCTLLGIPPRNLLPELGEGKIPTAPAEVALGIPCELLRRRPDVRRAEREVAAQSALIGVAVADLYPAFSLRGSIGYEAQNLSRLFVPTASTGLISPGFSWNVLNYGRLRNNVRSQEAAFQAAALTYQSAVLTANQEVEDGITGFFNAQDQTLILADSVSAASKALDLTLDQYREGKVDFNRVFTIQDTKVSQQDEYAASQGDVALNLISLYKALGGGWEVRLGAGRDYVIVATPADEGETPEQADPPEALAPPAPTTPGVGRLEGVGEPGPSRELSGVDFPQLVQSLSPAENVK
ncbi:MAG: efflux transporter outer membrane subunit [Planctomycetota bacterium]